MCAEYKLLLDSKEKGAEEGIMSEKRCDDFFEMLLVEELSDDNGYTHSSLKQFLGLVGYIVYDPPSFHCVISEQQTRRQRKEQSLNVPLE